MKQTLCFVIISLVAACQMKAQKPIILTDTYMKIRNGSNEMFWCGLAAGDRIVFDLEVSDSLCLKGISFSEYEGNEIYNESDPCRITQKSIDIHHQGIYYFELWQSGFLAGKRFAEFKVVRYPGSAATQNFNSTVFWRTETDTVWYEETETMLERIDTIESMLVMEVVELGKKKKDNRAVISFNVPDSANGWAYYICTGNGGDMKFNLLTEQLEGKEPVVAKYGLLTWYMLGGNVPYTIKADMPLVQASFAYSKSDKDNFIAHAQEEEYGPLISMEFGRGADSAQAPQYLMLLNPGKKKTHVWVYISSVQIKEVYVTRVLRKYSIVQKEIPYLHKQQD